MRFEKVSLEAFMKNLKGCGIKEGYVTAYINIKIPERKTKFASGYDFVTPVDFDLNPGQRITIPTGIKCYFSEEEAKQYHLQLHVRSSVGIRKGIVLSNSTGIIDGDYYNSEETEGDMLIALWNTGTEYIHFSAGDRIIQGIFVPHGLVADDNTETLRVGGVGSTDE